MKGIDTNVLVRYLVQDHKQQSAKAARFIEQNCTPDTPCQVGHIVLAELVWVLSSNYKQTREEIALVIERLLEAGEINVMDSAVVWKSLKDYRASNMDFADHLSARQNEYTGCESTVTFDKKAARQPAFEVL